MILYIFKVVDSSQSDDSLPSLASLCALNRRLNCAERLKTKKPGGEFPVSRVADTEPSGKLDSNVAESESRNFAEVADVESSADVNKSEAEPVKVDDTELTRNNRGRRLTVTICDLVDGKNLADKGNAGRKSMSLKRNSRNPATLSMGLDDEKTGMESKSTTRGKGFEQINSLCELQVVCDKVDTKVKNTGIKKSGKATGDVFTEHKPGSSVIDDCNENISSNLANVDLEVKSTKIDTAADEQTSCPVDIVDKKILRKSRKSAKNSEDVASENLKPELPLSSKKNANEGKRSRKLATKVSSDNTTSELNRMNTNLSEDDGADEVIPDVRRKRCNVVSSKMNSKTERESKGTTIIEETENEDITDDASSVNSLADLNGNSRTKSGSGRMDRGNCVSETKTVKEAMSSDSSARPIFGRNAVEILDFGDANENWETSGDKATSRMSVRSKNCKTTDVETIGFASAVTEPTLDGDGMIGQRGRKSKVQSKDVDASVAKSDSRKRKKTEEICNQEEPTIKHSRDLRKGRIQIEDDVSQIESANSKASPVTESKRQRRVPKEPEGDKTKNKDSPVKPELPEQHLDEPKGKYISPVILHFKIVNYFTFIRPW